MQIKLYCFHFVGTQSGLPYLLNLVKIYTNVLDEMKTMEFVKQEHFTLYTVNTLDSHRDTWSEGES